jgi:2,3-bisphosphoglycerate-dependent phosphoglycerate mutase
MLHTLYIVRHAHPRQNTGIDYHRVPGPPLDERGREEATRAAHFLQPLGVQALVCSPLDRTRQTAAAVADAIGIAPVVEDRLAEHRPDETFDGVRARCGAWLADAQRSPHAVVAAVTHGSPVRALLGLLSDGKIDLTAHNYAGGNPSPTAGIWRAVRAAAGWELTFVFDPQAAAALRS